MLPGEVKLAIRTLIDDNKGTLVSGMTRGGDRSLVVGLITTSRMTSWSENQFGYHIDIGEIREWYDKSQSGGGSTSRASVVANALKRAEYHVEIQVTGQSFKTHGERPDATSVGYETADAQFDLLLARTVKLFRDNLEFQSVSDEFTIGVKRNERRDQDIRVRNWSGVSRRNAPPKPEQYASITFVAETCGEPDPS